jgi:methionyl-tRNA formyltransferase
MKITILANKDIASNTAINKLLPKLVGHETSLFLSSKVGAGGPKPAPLKSLKFFEQNLFNDLVSPLLPAVTSGESRFRSFTQFNELLQQPFEELNRINAVDGLAKIQQCAPDLIISIRYGARLKDDVIAMPRLGVLNLHSGLLPDYRGVMATFWAMLNDEKIIGTTLHYINNSAIDEGDIVATTALNVDTKKSYLWHVLQLYTAGCENIINTVTALEKGENIDAYAQPAGGQYFTFPTQEDLHQFNDKGLVLVDEIEMSNFIKDKYY